MTELIIDGVRVVLSSDFAVTVKQENPFITKNGEYTYDCTMSLLNPVNANLYSFLQRINKKEAFATNRRVILIADNRVYCDGTEVITKWTDSKVTIQIVSGNSQLNYFIGSDKLISSLDMGSAVVTAESELAALSDYRTRGYAFPTALVDGTVINQYLVDVATSTYKPNQKVDFYAMPYLAAYIEKIIVALGYTVNQNAIKNTDYQDIILYHGVSTNEFSKMLPGWTCKDFLEEVEKFFNIVFVIDKKTKKVDIITQAKYYETAVMVHVIDVKDAYELDANNSDDDDDEHTTSNIGYGLSEDEEYYRMQRLSDGIKSVCTPVSETYSQFNRDYTNDTIGDRKLMLDTDPNTGKKYIYKQPEYPDDYPDNMKRLWSWYAYEVDVFKNLIQKEGTTDIGIELDILPAIPGYSNDCVINTDGTYAVYEMCTCAKVNANTDSKVEKQDSAHDYIINYVAKSETKSTIYASFYSGKRYDIDRRGNLYEVKPEMYFDDMSWYDASKNVVSHAASFRLQKIKDDFYNTYYKIDRKKKLIVESYDKNIYDTRQVFEIRNKRFVCESIEYALDSKGRKGTWKGIFYPVEISDTDAEHLWILADGRWRDNGVWLDNGRWIDN